MIIKEFIFHVFRFAQQQVPRFNSQPSFAKSLHDFLCLCSFLQTAHNNELPGAGGNMSLVMSGGSPTVFLCLLLYTFIPN